MSLAKEIERLNEDIDELTDPSYEELVKFLLDSKMEFDSFVGRKEHVAVFIHPDLLNTIDTIENPIKLTWLSDRFHSHHYGFSYRFYDLDLIKKPSISRKSIAMFNHTGDKNFAPGFSRIQYFNFQRT